MKIASPIIFRNSDFTRASIASYYNSSGFLDEALVDEVRLGFNPATLEFMGPILEGESTNVLTQSNNFAHADWTPSHSGVTVGISSPYQNPSGNNTTQYLDCSASFGRLERENPLAPGVIGTFSIYAHQEVGNRLGLTGSGNAIFDLSTGTVFIGDSATIQHVGGGWWRCSVTGPSTSSPLTIALTSGPYRVRLFGAQLEAGTVATSYIATTAAPVTRAADIENTAPPRVIMSSIPENDAPVWDDAETYNAGDKVMVLGQVHRIYSAVGTNTNKYPPTYSPSEWIDEGATNRWRMFDMAVGAEKQTTTGDSSENVINVLVEVAQAVTALVLMNVYGSSADVTMRDGDGNIVYTHHENLLQPPSISGWWHYFFGPRQRATTIVLTDLPNIQPSTIEVTLNGGETFAAIGKLILGEAIDIGCAKYGTGLGILDFSRKERDAFGNNFILVRRFVSRADFNIQIKTSRVEEINNLLADVRATPILYIGEEDYRATIIYGFYRDYQITIDDPKFSNLTLQIEGI